MVYPITDQDEDGLGALFGMMGDVGSDLESGLMIEAIGVASDAAATWRFAPIRMTDMETYMKFDDQPVWESVRSATDTAFHDTPHVYFRFQDKTVAMGK